MTQVNYIIACHEGDKPNFGFIVPEAPVAGAPNIGPYPQCRSLAAWLNNGLTTTPSKWSGGSWFFTKLTSVTFFSTLETLETLRDRPWSTVQCANVWDFFNRIGYDYKTKTYISPCGFVE